MLPSNILWFSCVLLSNLSSFRFSSRLKLNYLPNNRNLIMNLLPKSHKDFSQKDYWDNFFKKRGSKAFEWYGEYPELCEHLHKYIRPNEMILITGCGNSSLGNDMYDIGYKNITNIDISQVAIQQMTNLNSKKRPNMKFLHMDTTETSFDDESFNVVIDKGTLDALMPDNKVETVQLIERYFSEMLRVLKTGGRFLCISLLQEHILRKVADYFPKNHCMLRIVRCFEPEKSAAEAGESSLPVFIVICTKFKLLPSPILEVNLCNAEKMQRLKNVDDLIESVLMTQKAALVCSGLQKNSIQDNIEDVSLDLYRPDEDIPRYTIFVVDIKPERKNIHYAAFVVPQGRESEWLFSTSEGRRKLASISRSNRLAVVTMHRQQVYENLDVVKEELQGNIRNFAPAALGNEKILFLSLGPDVGKRNIVFKGNSKFSGDYVIEDVQMDDQKCRRLYYMQSQLVIQSEARLKQGKSRSGNFKETVDLTYLTCEHHIYISKLIHIASNTKEQPSTLIIGLGGGGLCSFLKIFLPKLQITAVDIDEDMLNVAKSWFGLKTDKNLQVFIENGLNFLAENKEKFDSIVFDVDSKDSSIGMSCPPKEFIESAILKHVAKSLADGGLFIANVVLRDANLRPDVVKKLKRVFKTVMSCKLEQDLNEIFICHTAETKMDAIRQGYLNATLAINQFLKENKHFDLMSDDKDCLNLC